MKEFQDILQGEKSKRSRNTVISRKKQRCRPDLSSPPVVMSLSMHMNRDRGLVGPHPNPGCSEEGPGVTGIISK